MDILIDIEAVSVNYPNLKHDWMSLPIQSSIKDITIQKIILSNGWFF